MFTIYQKFPVISFGDVNGKRFFGWSRWKIPGISRNFEKVVTISRMGRSEWIFVYHLCISQFQLRPATPTPPPRLLRGICPPCQSLGWGIFKFCAAHGPGICQPRGHSQLKPQLDTHAVSYQNITTQRILPEKKADWLICQGQEKIKEGCKGMFLILCMHFFIAYQARITYSEIWSYRRT